ncbi:hypothetical protein Leryth_010582 [Lithospermum erythrorhizon]|nr:hypothetical protein Leryth_010582 [Lithospermum erythrorhizon]
MRSSSTSLCCVLFLAIVFYGVCLMELGDAQTQVNVLQTVVGELNVRCNVEPTCLSTCKQLCGTSSNATCVDNIEYPRPKCACEFKTTDDCTVQKVC